MFKIRSHNLVFVKLPGSGSAGGSGVSGTGDGVGSVEVASDVVSLTGSSYINEHNDIYHKYVIYLLFHNLYEINTKWNWAYFLYLYSINYNEISL